MKYPYVIIDLDSKTINTIQSTLQDYPDYICLGIAGTEEEGINLILERSPQIVFLEVEVPGQHSKMCKYSIISELQKYVQKIPDFIVVTKTEKYAIEGIRNNIIDYIIKPADANLLRRTILRYEKNFVQTTENTICFKSYGDYRFVDLDEVLYLKADSNTTDFMLYSGQTVEAFKTLKHFQQTLPEHFVRIHNSYIVNSNFISRIHFGKSKCTMKNLQVPIPFSRSYKDNVRELKNQLFKNSILQL